MFPEPGILGSNFYDIFKVLPNQQRKSDWKKLKKPGSFKMRDKRKMKMDVSNNIGVESETPEVSLPGNASSFAVFATLRLAVLERWMRQACEIYASSSACSPHLAPQQLSDDETEDTSTEKTKETTPKIPKIVGVGLRSVFELIRESRASHPALCTKALLALLDVLQGQQPEGLKNEPIQVIEPLFDLLLDLAMHPLPDLETSSEGNAANQLTAVACACLLSLVTVRGDTGKLLRAVSSLLMCPKPVASQNIILPNVLLELDRSVYTVLLGKLVCPDWITHGVPKSSCISTFTFKAPETIATPLSVNSMASDGQFLYVHCSQGLFKIGSGYSGTIKGHVYAYKDKFHENEKSWLGFISNSLYFRGENSSMEWEVIDRNSLAVTQVISMSSSYSPCDISSGVMFTDCNQFAVISVAKDDGFVVRYMNPNSPSTLSTDLPLKLARKTVEVFGSATFDEETNIHPLHTGFDDEIAAVVSGKEFSLARTTNGKVFYSGKGSVLGIKQSWPRTGRWSELIIPKASKIIQIAVGHEGSHAILVTEDGSTYFTGTARRGEDGDQSKVRRQAKTVKPKKMAKMDGHFVVNAACNNGTTALVTREGELFMFGKDTSSCDPATGLVSELKDTQITQIALGKAHAVALTSKGHIYTFGINNKGQCGREFTPLVKDSTPHVVAMETAVEEDAEDGDDSSQDMMCEPGTHKWKHDLCMVCTICRECTGYSISCLSSMRPDRNPGQECGCGEGDSGCEECGCCRICARENVDNSELAILGPSGAGDVAGMMRLDLIFGGRHGSRLQDHLQRRLDERKQRQRGRIGMVRHAANTRARLNQRAAAGSAQSSITKHIVSKSQISSSSNNLIVEDGVSGGGGSDIEKDATRVTSLPPARVTLPSASPVVQIACGLHHTVVLTQDGEVFTFGSNNYGQLGMGDVQVRGGPVCVKFPTQAIHVAAGSNHTVVVSAKGELYSFGSHQKNQLGRGAPSKESSRNHWYSVPGLVPQTGARYGRRATWVGASADQTYVRIDESLINSISLKHSALVANKSCIMLLPTQCSQSKQFKCLVISKRDGNCIWFSGDNQVDFSRCTVCLDPLYNVLWSYQLNASNNQISCYNVIASEAPIQNNHSPSLLNCELTLPCVPGTSVSSAQIALHLLASLDTLTGSQHLQHQPQLSDDKMLPVSKHYSREDYCYVNRFEGHGGGWGYSGHSTEAIRFMVDSDILLGGFGLFGGRGEYTGKIKLFDIGMEGGDQEGDGELLAETEEIAYECGPRQKFPLFFEESVPLQANRWYVAWARVSGPSSDCGSGGQAIVSADDQVVFYFKTSKKSNNGTDVNAGQIPQLLYHLVTPESQAPTRHVDSAKEVYILSREFSRTASKECFESLLSLLEWSWASYKTSLVDAIQHNIGSVNHILATLELKYLVYICCACLRLLRIYTTEIYPNQVSQKKRVLESVLLAESVGDVRALLRQILTDNLPSSYRSCKSSKNHSASSIFIKLTKEILDECHETFVSCYHVFYPTVYLKWTSLCDLLSSTEKVSVMKYDRLLSAVFAALCNPTVRLRSTFPIFSTVMECNESSLKRQLSPADNSGLPMMPCLDTHHYPILVEQMSYRSQLEGVKAQNTWTFKDVLDRLLDLIYIPVMQALSQEKVSHSKQLAHYCCQLIARVVAELTAQTTGVDEDVDGGCGRVLYTTPSRFSRTNPTRTWNTGNGSPDAICFSVDRVGIVIAGVGVYGGAGNYDYELEILDNGAGGSEMLQSIGECGPYVQQSTVGQETQRWNSLQMTRGTFSSDDVNNEDIADIKFDFPIFIKENVKYAIRLRNHGGRTSNGDGGLSSVRGPDNTLFTFSTCSLSFNGTTQTRGQIPYILYYSDPTEQECAGGSKSLLEAQARKITLNIASAVVSRTVELFTLAREKEDFQTLSGVDLVTTLLPLMLAHIGPLASSEPRCGVQVLNLIQDLLPHVCALNLMAGSARLSASEDTTTDITTTSHHYAWVESDHPYKPATVSNYRVLFPESVQWMCLEFDSRSGTAQSEDSLQLYIPASAASVQQALDSEVEEIPPYWPVLHRLSSQPSHWPQSAIVLPGNEVIFSLETASDYIKDDKACTFGFRCLVIGYEWRSNSNDGLKQLETELSFLGGMCTASLMKKDLSLPFTINGEDVDSVDEETEMVCNQHMSLLGKGFALANPPTVSQALDGILPFR